MCAGDRQAAEHEEDAEGVEDVVDVEAVSRPLMAANARERAVEAVAEPVDRETARRPRAQREIGSTARNMTPTMNMDTRPSAVR